MTVETSDARATRRARIMQAISVGESQEALRDQARRQVDLIVDGVREQIKAEATWSNGALQPQLLNNQSIRDRQSVTPFRLGGSLTWQACEPARTLTVGRARTKGHIAWNLSSSFAGLDLPNRPPGKLSGLIHASAWTPDLMDHLVDALLDQEAWGAGTLPHVKMPGSADDADD